MINNKVWFVTGASKGLGLTLVRTLLAQGYQVAATSRNVAELTQAVPDAPDNFLPLVMHLTDEGSVQQALAATVQIFGRLDVVVNNAGYGQYGALEELSDQEARRNFDVNVFGLLNILRHATPYLRRQQSGHVLNLSSIVGFFVGLPGWSVYCATKFAVEGLSEAYAAEVKDFGIRVTSVKPGYFRTSFFASDSLSRPQNALAEYPAIRAAQALHAQQSVELPGDPAKAAAVLLDVSQLGNPPLHLFLGEDAYYLAEEKLMAVRQDMEQWRSIATNTDFD